MKIVRLDPWGRPLARAEAQDAVAGVDVASTLQGMEQAAITPIGAAVGLAGGAVTGLFAKFAFGASLGGAFFWGILGVPATLLIWTLQHQLTAQPGQQGG